MTMVCTLGFYNYANNVNFLNIAIMEHNEIGFW